MSDREVPKNRDIEIRQTRTQNLLHRSGWIGFLRFSELTQDNGFATLEFASQPHLRQHPVDPIGFFSNIF